MILGPLERLGPDQRRAWAAARVWAAHQAPYMASALLALDPVVVDQSDDHRPGSIWRRSPSTNSGTSTWTPTSSPP